MTGEVLIAAKDGIGRFRLNRPKAIHALTQAMCEAMRGALAGWRDDPDVRLVMLDHAEGRGFCAGGDIRAVAESGRGDGVAARAFFHAEYQLNHLLFTCAKPTIALMDGITLGGGVGIALPCRYRVATERTVLAMPETGIGLFPDVGGGWYLSRLPGRLGEYLGLTGARLSGADCKALGIATHYLPSAALDAVKAAIAAAPGEVGTILNEAAVMAPAAAIIARQAEIDRLFAGETLEEILAALDAEGSEWAARERAILASKSPLSCKVALRQLFDSRTLVDFADEMRMEYRIVAHMCQRHDFIEGVRALLVDKDNAPRWEPATPDAVTDHVIDIIFRPVEADEQWEPWRG